MRQLHARPRLRRNVLRGATFVYFALIAIPVMWFGSAMAVDFTRIVIAHRQVANATQAAALAGAQQFVVDAAEIDPEKSRVAARETYCVAVAAGQLPMVQARGTSSSCVRGEGRVALTVTPIASGTSPTGTPTYMQVEVTSRYRVTGLLFGSFFGAKSTYDADPVTRSAAICLPGVATGPTNGFCAKPSGG